MPVIKKVEEALAQFRIKVDDREEVTPGFKFNDWEMRGVPLRLEIGPKDVEKGTVMAARRDIPGKAGKSFLPMENITESVGNLLETIQSGLLERATKFRDENIHDPKDYQEFKETVKGGWAFSWWCGDRSLRRESAGRNQSNHPLYSFRTTRWRRYLHLLRKTGKRESLLSRALIKSSCLKSTNPNQQKGGKISSHPFLTKNMPAVQLTQLKSQIDDLLWKYTRPEEFLIGVHQLI